APKDIILRRRPCPISAHPLYKLRGVRGIMSKPVFHDPSGRRGRRTRSSMLLLLLLVLAVAAVFAMTIVDVPIPGPLPVQMEQAKLHAFAERLGIVRHKGLKRAYYGSP